MLNTFYCNKQKKTSCIINNIFPNQTNQSNEVIIQHSQLNQSNIHKQKKDTIISKPINSNILDELIELQNNYKYELLQYLYSNIDIISLKYTMLKTTDQIQQLKQQQSSFNIIPHYHGYNFFFIITKLSDGVIGMYLVYRLDLKYNLSDNVIDNIKIYKLNTTQNIDIFNNTIFDGRLISNKDRKIFLITDMLYYKSNKYLSYLINDKLKILETDIDDLNKIIQNNIEISIVKIYKISDLYDLVYNKIKNTDFKINGIIFVPKQSGHIYIYTNDLEFETIKRTPHIDDKNMITNIKLSKDDDLSKKELLLQKTQTIDVYNVFSIDKQTRFGICAIPTIELSHKLRSYFKTNDQLSVQCEFDNKFCKWRPLY